MLRILKLATSFSKESDPADGDLSSESKTKTNPSDDDERYVYAAKKYVLCRVPRK